ncbi:hypothetical protein [Streptomyces sp. NPDC017520]|uniref:hypothetical protein n=1 Tax=Streptomyces sp. NPDC017520 TaxID=3364998 RepID=UPI0037ADC13E
MTEGDGENAEGFPVRRVDAAEDGEQLSGRRVRVDARRVLRAEQVLEGAVGGDPLHDDIEFPPGVPIPEDDRVTDRDGVLPRSGHHHLDRLAACFHLAVVAPEQVDVVFVWFVSGRRARDSWIRLLGVVGHACLPSMWSVRCGPGITTGSGVWWPRSCVAGSAWAAWKVGGVEADENVDSL